MAAASWFVVGLFVGVLLFMEGYYRKLLERARRETRVEYRFVPRTLYEEQFFGDTATPSSVFRGMFQKVDPLLAPGTHPAATHRGADSASPQAAVKSPSPAR